MEHLKLQQWIDFARGLYSVEEKSKMQRHLDDCADCKAMLNPWTQFAASVARDRLYEPPAGALRTVNAHFALQRPSRTSVIKQMKLAFDSLVNALPAGIRSSGSSARQLLYRSGNYSVDLRVELQADSGKIALVGQVLNADEQDRGIGDIPVHLQTGDGAWQGVTTNHLGEFHFECPESDSLQLSFGVNPKRTLVVSIPLAQDVPSPQHWL